MRLIFIFKLRKKLLGNSQQLFMHKNANYILMNRSIIFVQ
nr:MAG TPA: hypothetical protein [Caudoviricetes sp.]